MIVLNCIKYRRFLNHKRDDPEYRKKFLCALVIQYSCFLFCGPLLALTIYLLGIAPNAKQNELYDECYLTAFTWLFLVLRQAAQETVKSMVISKYYEFPLLLKTDFSTIITKQIKFRWIFYLTFWFTCGILIAWAPCIIRVSNLFHSKSKDYESCYYNGWHLLTIIINMLNLMYVALVFGRATAILSKRWLTAMVYIRPAIKYWSMSSIPNHKSAKNIVRKWHQYMLNIS